MQQELELHDEDNESESKGSISPLEIIVFLGRAAKRHARLGISVGLAVAIVGTAIALVLPSKYESESRILAVQSAAVTAALSNPNRPDRGNIDPFGGSTEILTQKSNLLWLAKEANVPARWNASRSPPLRLKDNVLAALFGKASEQDTIRAVGGLLEHQMYVAHDNTVLTIHVAWQDPESAWKLAQLAQSRFLELRRKQELAAITAAISVNEDEVKRAAETIDQSLQELIRVRDRRAQKLDAPSDSDRGPVDAGTKPSKLATSAGQSVKSNSGGPSATTAAAAVAVPVPDKKLAARLADIRQQAREIETPWQRRLAEQKFQLNDLRGTYGPEHPLVLQQEAKIRAASDPPADLSVLREQERQILTELENVTVDATKSVPIGANLRSGTVAPLTATPASARNRFQSSDGTLIIAEKEDDPVVSPAKAGLAAAIQRYSEAVKRLDTARLELTTSEVAFQYRYAVVGEPERPGKATKPNRPQIIIGALAAAALLGMIAGAIRDILSGRIFEPWQLRLLGVPVLGELSLTQKRK